MQSVWSTVERKQHEAMAAVRRAEVALDRLTEAPRALEDTLIVAALGRLEGTTRTDAAARLHAHLVSRTVSTGARAGDLRSLHRQLGDAIARLKADEPMPPPTGVVRWPGGAVRVP